MTEHSKAYLQARRTWWARTAEMSNRELWESFARFEHGDTEAHCGALAAIEAEIEHRDCYQ